MALDAMFSHPPRIPPAPPPARDRGPSRHLFFPEAPGSGLEVKPVLALHCILLPLNFMRLIKVMRERQESPSRDVSTPCP
jgi:hypothetical protein